MVPNFEVIFVVSQLTTKRHVGIVWLTLIKRYKTVYLSVCYLELSFRVRTTVIINGSLIVKIFIRYGEVYVFSE